MGIVRLKAEVSSDYWYSILHGCEPPLLIIGIVSLPKSSAIPSGLYFRFALSFRDV
jgi:hypothetical protein